MSMHNRRQSSKYKLTVSRIYGAFVPRLSIRTNFYSKRCSQSSACGHYWILYSGKTQILNADLCNRDVKNVVKWHARSFLIAENCHVVSKYWSNALLYPGFPSSDARVMVSSLMSFFVCKPILYTMGDLLAFRHAHQWYSWIDWRHCAIYPKF